MILIGGLYFPDGERHFQVFGDAIADYQRPQRDRAFEFVTDWRLAVDIGANVGIFARHFAERFDEVWAVEPVPDAIECLRLNVSGNVVIKPFAMGSEIGRRQIYQNSPKSVGGSFIVNDPEVFVPEVKFDSSCLVDVDLVTLDSLELSAVGLIKLDVQGSEVAVLKGGRDTLERCRPVILIEEKPLGGPAGDVAHIQQAQTFLQDIGMTAKDRVGADRIYVFE